MGVAGFGAIRQAVATFAGPDGIPGLHLAAVGARDAAKVEAALPSGMRTTAAIDVHLTATMSGVGPSQMPRHSLVSTLPLLERPTRGAKHLKRQV